MKSQAAIWEKSYENGLFWKKEAIKIKKIMNKKSVLELGVGNGKTLKSIIQQGPRQVVAIDISGEAIKILSRIINADKIKFVKSDFLKFDTSRRFDVIVCYYFLNNFKKEQRITVVKKIKSILNPRGAILFEDFAIGDFRENKGVKKIEKNTIRKQNGLICHFFEKKEIFDLFKDFRDIKVEEKTFSPIRTDKTIQRKILNAIVK